MELEILIKIKNFPKNPFPINSEMNTFRVKKIRKRM